MNELPLLFCRAVSATASGELSRDVGDLAAQPIAYHGLEASARQRLPVPSARLVTFAVFAEHVPEWTLHFYYFAEEPPCSFWGSNKTF